MTVDVHTHELARPFLVLATQNPIEYEGTYPLPEAQLDRFLVKLTVAVPGHPPVSIVAPGGVPQGSDRAAGDQPGLGLARGAGLCDSRRRQGARPPDAAASRATAARGRT